MTKEKFIASRIEIIKGQLSLILEDLDYPKEDTSHEDDRKDLIAFCELQLGEYIPRWVELVKFAQAHLLYNYQAHGDAKPYLMKNLDKLTNGDLKALKELLK